MKRMYLILGILMLFVTIAVTFGAMKDYYVMTKGKTVPVIIIEVPSTTGHGISGMSGIIKFYYNGTIEVNRISTNNQYHVGDTVLVKHSDAYPTWFVFEENKKDLFWAPFCLAIGLSLSFWAVYYDYKQRH